MHLLAGLDRPTSGEVWIDGTKLGRLGDTALTRLRRRHIGFIFQFFSLLPMLTAEENILLPLSLAGRKPDLEWSRQLIEDVSLTARRTHRPAELSGGQQQRVAIARALVSKPAVVFADEPTGNSTRPRAARSWSCSAAPSRTIARPSWSRTTRTPPRSPTGSSSSPTAASSRNAAGSNAHEVLETIEEVSGR